jgi:hypothetical protein
MNKAASQEIENWALSFTHNAYTSRGIKKTSFKESIKGADQIFILTHHFDFFRQVKNWFSYCNENVREYFMMLCCH